MRSGLCWWITFSVLVAVSDVTSRVAADCLGRDVLTYCGSVRMYFPLFAKSTDLREENGNIKKVCSPVECAESRWNRTGGTAQLAPQPS